MATMTVAQALASSATGITIVDTPANIAAVVSNSGLLARVTQFTLNGNGASNASDARLLATLGSRFSPGSYRYVVRDTVGALSDQRNAAGLALASAFSVFDTASNLLAASSSSLMQRAGSVVLSSGASLSLANLLRLEALPAFSVLPGQSITLIDTAANLLALTPAQNRPAIKAFQVVGTSNVDLASALVLKALPAFSVASGSNLVVTGTAADMTAVGNATAVASLAAVRGVVISVSDTIAHILPAVSALSGLVSRAGSSSIVVNESGTIDAAGATSLLPLFGRLFVAGGKTLTLADTAEHLLATARNAASMVQATALASDANVSAAQLAALTGMRGFSVQGGVHLTVTDTLAALTALTVQQRALPYAVVVQDTAQHLLQAVSLPSGTTALIVQLEGGTYSAAQAAQIGGLAHDGIGLTLQPIGGATEIVVSDTIQAIASEAGRLAALIGHGPVVFSPTDHDVTLSATSAVAVIGLGALDIGAAGISVSDTGDAITAARTSLFAADLVSIVVTDGVFSGSLDELLDPRLHLGTGSGIVTTGFTLMALASTPSAHLATDATVSAGQMIALSLLSGFAVDPGVTLTVADTAASLVSAAAAIGSFATEILVEDDATLTADQATTLAELQDAVGPLHFSMDGHTLTVADSAGHITALANAPGVRLATTVALDSDSVVTAAQAQVLVDMGARFTTGEHDLVVIDTATALSVLAADIDAVTAINGWGAPVLLSADAMLDLAAGQALLRFEGFGSGAHRLTIADTAANLLADTEAAPLALASAVRLSADATVTAAAAAALADLRSFGTGGHALTIADTPAQLLEMAGSVAALATNESLVPRTVGNAADYTITAAQLGQLLAMPHLSASGFTGLITVADTADALAALAPTFANVTLGSLLSRVVVSLTGDAVLGATSASALAQLPGFALGGHSLTVHDTPTALLSPDAMTGIGMATSVGINGPATVGVTVLTALANLHAFNSDGYPLVCADTPVALLGLSSPAAAFADRLEVAAPAGDLSPYTLTTAQFTTLATTAKLSLTGFGGTLVVRDTPAALVALASSFMAASSGAPLLAARAAMAAQLSQDGTVGVSDLQALADLPQFQLNGHSLVLQDTPAALLGAGLATLSLASSITLASDVQPWSVDAAEASFFAALPNFTPGSTGFVVVDTAPAILLPGNAAGLALATGVTLSADATVTALDAATLAALLQAATFSRNGHALVLRDSGAHIAAYAPTGSVIPTGYEMVGEATLTAAQATLLATRAVDLGGNALTVADTVSALLDAGSVAGEAIATTVRLVGNATASAAQADLLFAMPNFNTGGYVLTVTGTATDLLGLGTAAKQFATTLALVASETVDVATLAGLVQFGFKFDRAGHTLTVQDDAANLATLNTFETVLAGSEILGTSAIVDADTAESLAALPAFTLGSGVTLTVQDTAEALIGLSAAVRAVASVERLPPGSALITAAEVAGLRALPNFVSTGTAITVQPDSVANVLAFASDVAAIGATIAIFDTAANVLAALDGLQALPPNLVGSITLSDGGTPAMVMTIATLAADAAVLSAIVSPYTVTITDTAAHIATDLSVGSGAALLVHRTAIGSVVVSGGGIVGLTDAEALTTGVADGPASIMAKLSGSTFVVSSAGIANLDALSALATAPAAIAVLDTAAHIEADLASGSSRLLAHRLVLSGVTVSGGGTITLTDAQVQTAHVNDGAGSVFSLLSGAPLVVIGVSVAHADAIAALPVAPQSFAVSDTAAAIEADLASGLGSHLLAHLAMINEIGVSDAGMVSLTAAETLADGVDDSAGSALAKLAGGTFRVTDAPVALLGALANLARVPDVIAVTDNASEIEADLIAGPSQLLSQLARISSIVVADSGVITLTVGQTLAAGVDDGPNSVMAKLQGGSFLVSGAHVTDLDVLAALPVLPTSILVSATAAEIVADVTSGQSKLLAYAAQLFSIDVSDGGTISLSVAQVTSPGVDDGPGSVLARTVQGSLQITGATVADFPAIDALSRQPTGVTVVDTAANLQSDLANGNSVLRAHAAEITSIESIEPIVTFTLSVAQLSPSIPVLERVASLFEVTVVDTAANLESDLANPSSIVMQLTTVITGILLTDGGMPTITLSIARFDASRQALNLIGGPYHLDIADTGTALQADLVSADSILRASVAAVDTIAVTGGTTITLTVSQALEAGVAAVLAITTGVATVMVTDVAIADVATVAALGIAHLALTIRDTAAAVEADLAGSSPALEDQAGAIAEIILTDVGTPTLHFDVARLSATSGLVSLITTPYTIAITDTAANVQNDLAGATPELVAHASALSSITLTDGGTPTIALSMTQVSAAGMVLASIGSSFHLAIADTAANVQADLASITPTLLTLLPSITAITLTDGGTPSITLTLAQVAADSAALSLIGTPWQLQVADTAANVEADLAAGATSVLLGQGANLAGVTLSSGTTITLTEAQATYTGVAAVLAVTAGLGSFVVTDVTVAQIPTVLGLGIASTGMTIVDTAAQVQADLTGAGDLLTNIANISAITLTDGTIPTITLSIAQVVADHAVLVRVGLPWFLAVADTAANLQADLAAGAGSALTAYGVMLSGVTLTSGNAITLTETQVTQPGIVDVLAVTSGLAALTITGVSVAHIPNMLGLGIPGTALGISDTAAHIEADLIGAGDLLAHDAVIGAISLTDGGSPTITLTLAQLRADTSILGKIALPWSLAITDTAANLQADLALGGGSALVGYETMLTGVTLSGGDTITLTEAQATSGSVASILGVVSGLNSFIVTDVTLAQIATVLGLGVANTHILVADTAANVQSDLTAVTPQLTSGSVAAALQVITLTDGTTPTITLSLAQATAASAALQAIGTAWHLVIADTAAQVQADLAAGAASTLLGYSAELTGVTLTSGSTITLTEAQATRAGVGAVMALISGLTGFVVTDATIAQVADVLALSVANTSLTITDTAAHLQSDLNLAGTSVLLTNISSITAIALSDGGTPTLALNVAGLTSAAPVLSVITSSYALALSDTAAHVQADLAASAGSEILAQIGSLASITLSAGDTITLTEAQATYSGVAAALTATTGLNIFVVTGVAIGQISTVLGLGVSGTRISVSDTAANVQSDLSSGGVLLSQVASLVEISLTDAGTPTLTVSVAEFGTNAAVLALIGGTFTLTVSDSAANVQSDLTGGSSVLLPYAGVITNVTLTDGGTPALALTVAQVAASTAVLTRISSTYVITISDTAANVEADLVAASPGLVAVDGVLGSITLTDGTTPTITLSVAQISAGATVLGQIGSTYDLVAADTSVHVQLDLAQGAGSALLGRGATLTGITLTTGSTIALTEAQAVHAGVATALGLVTGMSIFLVVNVAVAQIGTVLGLGVSGTRLAIEDTAANVLADITGAGDLLAHLGVIFGISLTDPGTPDITLTLAQVSTNDLVLNAITSPWTLAVADSAANVQADLAAGAGSVLLAHGSVLGSITLSGGTTITLTEAEAVQAGVAAALVATTNLSSFVVTGVTVAQLATVLALAVPHTSVAVSDSAAHVQADLVGPSALLAGLVQIGSITLTDGGTPTLALDIAQLSAGAPVLAQIGSSYQLVITDTAAHVQADLALGASSALVTHRSLLSQLNVSDGDIILTSAEVQVAGVDDGASSVLALMSGAQLYVTGVSVADITTVLGLSVVPQNIMVLDDAANIVADIAGAGVIASHAAAIFSVRTTETTLDAATATTLYNALQAAGTIFAESALTVTDTAAALLTAAAAAPVMLASAAHVTMTGNPTSLTAAQATTLAGILHGVLQNGQTMGVADTVSNLLLTGNAAGILLATSVTLDAPATTTAALATQLAGLHAYTAGPSLTVEDTIANLLDGANLAGINAATTVSPSTDVTVSATILNSLALLPHYAAGTHVLTVQDTAAAVLALTPTELGFAGIISVQDTVANVTASVGTLQTAIPDQGHTLSITLTDASSNVIAIDLTATGYAAAADTYAAITNAGVVRVTGNATQLAALASALQSNAAVGEVDVVDTADNVLSNLTALTGIGSKFMKATISDTMVNAAEVAALLTVPNLIATDLTIQDTGTQIAAAIMANGAPGLSFMDGHTVTLSADSVITASEAVLLEQLTSFEKNGHNLYIWDTAPHLTDSASGYLAAAQNALIDGVYLKATSHIATVSATLAASLLSISAFNRNDPPVPVGDGLSNTLLVQDTAARIETYWATLSANGSALSGVVVSASATVNDSVFGHLLSLGATMDSGRTLTVRDTAANIIANATSQLSNSPSITPAAWQISGSASVSTAGAILLGSLAGFAVGAYTLTLTDSATLTVAQANTLGTLGNSLQLGGHTLDLYGDVGTMTTGPGLSANAKLIVTPHITDTFANLATLTVGSGLLGGTINVSDSEAVTVAQASAFLSLLGGSGIPVANVAFGGQVESITDTLSAIQTLTGSSAWTSTTSVHGNFHLVVADTVATLINSSNTSALAAMNGTTLAGSETITAAAAESLFAVGNGIHFSKGGSLLTIQDTAAHLLNPAYSDGVALADALQLSGDDTVAAADAEVLLSNGRFTLNHTLTISDSSASLLDGVLASAISDSPFAASIVVELGAAETMDAGTARALVNLPGYHDTGNLTIADDASYLLNSANHGAEVLATSVTLNGDETVSIATAGRLSALPHFTVGSSTLHLASNDFADAAALVTIGNLDAHWDSAGFSIRMTQDALALTPGQYAALRDDNIVLNGHALSALATGVSVSSSGGTVQITGNGVANATLNVYASNGSILSQTAGVGASFTATAAEGSIGNGVVVTETVGASAASSESAPIIALERTVLTNAATSAGATFAASGAVQVDVGKYVDLYTTGSAPAHPSSPVLVYDGGSYTLSLSIDGQAALTLVTLGTATHPTSLSASEIYIQHFV